MGTLYWNFLFAYRTDSYLPLESLRNDLLVNEPSFTQDPQDPSPSSLISPSEGSFPFLFVFFTTSFFLVIHPVRCPFSRTLNVPTFYKVLDLFYSLRPPLSVSLLTRVVCSHWGEGMLTDRRTEEVSVFTLVRRTKSQFLDPVEGTVERKVLGSGWW